MTNNCTVNCPTQCLREQNVRLDTSSCSPVFIVDRTGLGYNLFTLNKHGNY